MLASPVFKWRWLLIACIFILIVCITFYEPASEILCKAERSEGAGGLSQLLLNASEKCRISRDNPCLRPFVPMGANFLSTDDKKIAICKIAKTMSTTLTATVCYLDREQEFLAQNRSIHTEIYDTRFCGKRIEKIGTPISGNDTIDDWNMLAIIRHPLERFMSGFIDKCIWMAMIPKYAHFCYGCKGNLPCFLDRLYKHALRFSGTENWRHIGFVGLHFYPQNWYCNFLEFPQMKVIRFTNGPEGLSRMRNEFLGFLKEAKVADTQLKYIESELSLKSPHQMTDSTLMDKYLAELFSSQALLDKFMQIFYYDFLLFGFTV
ncbi:unnamed protein product, partial [Mesorhabditis spiculigera]